MAANTKAYQFCQVFNYQVTRLHCVTVESGLGQKYAFIRKSTIFIRSLHIAAKFSWYGYLFAELAEQFQKVNFNGRWIAYI